MAVETQTQITREAPEIEAYRLGLLESAKNLADQRITVPKQMVAGMSGLQDAAIAAASPKQVVLGAINSFYKTQKQLWMRHQVWLQELWVMPAPCLEQAQVG